MIKRIYWLFALIGIIAIGFLIGWIMGKRSSLFEKQEQVTSSVVIENIQKVLKLTTVEANMSELYNYKDYYSYDFSLFRKKAILRVNAKVLVGYDLKNFNLKVDSSKQQVVIEGWPNPEILAIDHNLDYYDIEQGLFNNFTNEDYNHINANAKDYIKKVALNKGLLKEANASKDDLINLWSLTLKGLGYNLILAPSKQDTLKK